MDRRYAFAVLALLLLGVGAALWFGIGGGAARESSSSEAPRAGTDGVAAGDAASRESGGPTLAARGTKRDSVEGDRKDDGTLVVHVRKTDGTPIPGARVVAEHDGAPRAAETDAQGVARLTQLSGWVQAYVTAKGFVGQHDVYGKISSGSDANIGFELAPGVPLEGRVVGGADDAPVSDAEITVSDSGPIEGGDVRARRGRRDVYAQGYEVTRSGADGRFHVQGVGDGRHVIVGAKVAGYVAASLLVRVEGGVATPSPVVVRLSLAGRLVGVVRGPDGAGVSGAHVYVLRRKDERGIAAYLTKDAPSQDVFGDAPVAHATSSGGGAFVVDGLSLDEEYVAGARSDGSAPTAVATGIRFAPPAREARLELALLAFGSLAVRVVDLDGRPLAEQATVRVEDPEGERSQRTRDESNLYRFEGLVPREYRVAVESWSFHTASARARVEAGGTTEIVIRLDPGASIEGVVTDEEGRPFAGATIDVKAADGPAPPAGGGLRVGDRESTADRDGRFVVGGLEAKEWIVAAHDYDPDSSSVLRSLEPIRVRAPASGVRLILVRFGTATLRVLTIEGKPFVGSAYVLGARKKGGPRSGSTQDIRDGKITWSGLKAGETEVEVRVAEHAPIILPFTARFRGNVDLGTATLNRGIEARGRVTDRTGAPVPNASVWGFRTDADGTFQVERLPRGPFRLRSSAEGFLPQEQEIHVAPGMDPILVVLDRGALVRVVLLDARGDPAFGTPLFAVRVGDDGKADPSLRREWDISSYDDGALAMRLPAGRWRSYAGPISDSALDTTPPLAEWTLAEGETRSVTLTLPAR